VARPRGGFQARTQRRRTGWEEGTGGTGVVTVTTTAPVFIGSAVAILRDGLTLVRTRGHVSGLLIAASGINDGFIGAFGIGVASTAAVVAGIASVPTPIAELDWDGWLFWAPIWAKSNTATLVGNVGTIFRQMIDSKAMRKVGEDMTIYAAAEVVLDGTASLEIMHDSRMLFKLP